MERTTMHLCHFRCLGQVQTQPFGMVASTQLAAATNNAVRPDDLLITSLTSPRLFNDERDELMLKWNILQVFYGTGKTFSYQGNTRLLAILHPPACLSLCSGVYDVDANLPYHIFKVMSTSYGCSVQWEGNLRFL